MLPCDLSMSLAFTEPQFLHLCTRDSGGHLPTYQHPPAPRPAMGMTQVKQGRVWQLLRPCSGESAQ